jgi:hypothetical protein
MKTVMGEVNVKKVAIQIATELMTYYSSKPQIASRIVMEFKDGKKLDGPGLNKSAIVGRIEEILEKEVTK